MIKLDKINSKINDLEVRTVGKNLIRENGKPLVTAEITKQIDLIHTHTYALAYWKQDKDGHFNLNFIGRRPFMDDINKDVFWTLAKYMQNYLDKKTNEQWE